MLVLTRRVSQSFIIVPNPKLDLATPVGAFFQDGPIEILISAVQGARVKLNVIWDWEAPAGTDTHFASYRGTRARVEVRQGKAEQYRPEVYVAANRAADKAAVLAAVKRKIAALQGTYPGCEVVDLGTEVRIAVPPGTVANLCGV